MLNQDKIAFDSHEVRKHYQTPLVAVVIPILQALVTGFFAGFVSFGLVLLIRAIWTFSLSIAFGIAFLVLGIVSFLSWLYLLSHWEDNINRLEQKYRIDINGDGEIGKPQKSTMEFVTTVLIPDAADTGEVDRAVFRMHPESFREMIDCILEKGKFTEEMLLKDYAFFDNRDEYLVVRDELIRIGALRWKNKQHHDRGLFITPHGVHILEGYKVSPPPQLVSYTK